MTKTRFIPLSFVALLALASPLQASASNDWLSQRQAEFRDWQAAHPKLEARIAQLKTQTVTLVERHEAEEQAKAEKRLADMIAQSQSLGTSDKQAMAALLKKASDHLKEGRCADAKALFTRVLDKDPANSPASVGMGQCLKQEGDLVGAAKYFTQTILLPMIDEHSEMDKRTAMMALQPLPAPHDPKVNEPSAIFRVPQAPTEIWDVPEAPLMTIIPAGEFTMGAPPEEAFYQEWETQHRVTIGYPLAVGTYNVTRGEFAAFVAATGYDAFEGAGCNIDPSKGFRRASDADWRSPGFAQSDNDPVVCVNYHDAVAYTGWLTESTGHTYRLPSESEWEYATRGGTTTMYYWGDEIGIGNANCDGCNGPSQERKTTPGGTFPPNPFGLYDMVGNVWKWLADCWNNSYAGAPADGSVWNEGNCALRGRRTGSWFNLAEPKPGDLKAPGRLRSAGRFGSIPGIRYSSYGFRVVREL